MKGINNSPETLTELFQRLHRHGVIPQYLFHPRPVKHATHFQLPIAEGMQLVEAVREGCNGSVKRFRYILTHEDGKLELVGILPGPMQLVAKWQQVRLGMGTCAVRFGWNAPGVKEAIAIVVPAILSSGMTQINIYVDLFFASYIPHAAAALNYAGLLAQTPKGILTSVILIPFMSLFSQLAAPENWLDLKLRIRQSLILSALTMLPLGVLMITLAVPIVRVVYERHAFDATASKLVASVLMAYGFGAFTSVAVGVLVRVFYALEDGQTPFRIGVLNILLNIVLDYFLVKTFGVISD